jgi:hypothetical protein
MKNKEQSPKMKPYCVNVGITPCDTEGISMEDALDNGVSFKQVHKIRKDIVENRRIEKKRTRQIMKGDLKSQIEEAGY